MILLGVNIDHVATVREARRGKEPDLVQRVAAVADELAQEDFLLAVERIGNNMEEARDLCLEPQLFFGHRYGSPF